MRNSLSNAWKRSYCVHPKGMYECKSICVKIHSYIFFSSNCVHFRGGIQWSHQRRFRAAPNSHRSKLTFTVFWRSLYLFFSCLSTRLSVEVPVFYFMRVTLNPSARGPGSALVSPWFFLNVPVSQPLLRPSLSPCLSPSLPLSVSVPLLPLLLTLADFRAIGLACGVKNHAAGEAGRGRERKERKCDRYNLIKNN